MDCTINGVRTPFLLDTGAAVTLLRKDTWDHVNLDNRQSLLSGAASWGGWLSVDSSQIIDSQSAPGWTQEDY